MIIDPGPLGDANDRRWERLQNRSWTCGSCGATHRGVFDIVYDKPAICPESSSRVSNSDLSPFSTNFLSDDFCIVQGEHYFVRCVLEFPISGTKGGLFAFGVWSSLSDANFAVYVNSFSRNDQSVLGPWFGWFSNRLPGYPDTLNLKCQVHPRDGRRRPFIELEPTDNPLTRDQKDGISIDRLIEIYAACGHDLRAALSD